MIYGSMVSYETVFRKQLLLQQLQLYVSEANPLLKKTVDVWGSDRQKTWATKTKCKNVSVSKLCGLKGTKLRFLTIMLKAMFGVRQTLHISGKSLYSAWKFIFQTTTPNIKSKLQQCCLAVYQSVQTAGLWNSDNTTKQNSIMWKGWVHFYNRCD